MKPKSGVHSRSSFHLVMKSKLQLHTMPPRLVHGIRFHFSTTFVRFSKATLT
jgi:hypothetical protein